MDKARTIYQQELMRKLAHFGCCGQYDDEAKMLKVSYDGIPLCAQGEDGFLRYAAEKQMRKVGSLFSKISKMRRRKFVSMYGCTKQRQKWEFPMSRNTGEWLNTATRFLPECTVKSVDLCLPHGGKVLTRPRLLTAIILPTLTMRRNPSSPAPAS